MEWSSIPAWIVEDFSNSVSFSWLLAIEDGRIRFAKDGTMRLAIFEDAKANGFAPIALTRPVFELLCGQFSARERLVRTLKATEWGCLVRAYLAETYQEDHPESRINEFDWLTQKTTLLINGRWLPTEAGLAQLREVVENERLDVVGQIGGEIAFILVEPVESVLLSESGWDEPLQQIAEIRTVVEVGGTLFNRPWDLIDHNETALHLDFSLRRVPVPEDSECDAETQSIRHATIQGHQDLDPRIVIQGNPENVFIDPAAEVDPLVMLDARSGPITIDAGAKIQAFTRLEGPCHVGTGSQLFRANVKAGTTIGPVCRVGGEIENSILHSHANKYHDGFLGHSYVCPWVNMGALTTNSDLKNDYSNVKVPLAGELVDSGSKKIGTYFGDHAKTALCSQFNTGSSVGLMSMVLPAGELLPKHIPSFSRVWHGVIDDHLDLENALATARVAMSRRDLELTSAQERLLRHLHAQSQTERVSAINRQKMKLASSTL